MLTSKPPLVTFADVGRLRRDLAQVAAGRARVIQIGDCAENPEEATPEHIARKAGLVEVLAGMMKMISQRPVVAVGRVAGQFGKPRSAPTEQINGQEIPAYFGHMVNRPEPDPESRKPDPWRLLHCYHAAREIVDHLGWVVNETALSSDRPVWTSHEALLLDYEIPMLRWDADVGAPLLTSTHWPWIGERTRQVDGPHVALLGSVVNPVACKIGPGATEEEVVGLCDRLDPRREPGRLTLISRMGADAVTEVLPSLVAAARSSGHPVIWLCDPMHANTIRGPNDLKTRFLETIMKEVRAFKAVVDRVGGVAGGLHLEAAADDVTECVDDESGLDHVGDRYTSFCDPRLNPSQAVMVVSAWTDDRPITEGPPMPANCGRTSYARYRRH